MGCKRGRIVDTVDTVDTVPERRGYQIYKKRYPHYALPYKDGGIMWICGKLIVRGEIPRFYARLRHP